MIAAILALGFFASWGWAFFVVALIFMIFMHELGHYLTARWTGMKVTEFFIGFGLDSGRSARARPNTASKASPPVRTSESSA